MEETFAFNQGKTKMFLPEKQISLKSWVAK